MLLKKSLNAWGKAEFEQTLKGEIEQLNHSLLPLQDGLSLSSYVSPTPIKTTILKITDSSEYITIKVGIFYTGIIAGCSCADDPTPLDEQNEYCEIEDKINKKTADADIILLDE